MREDGATTSAREPSVRLSVILACYNAEDTVGDQLDALAAQVWSEPWELIVVDNRCTDGTMRIVERYRGRIPNLRTIDALERPGQPYALNVGAQMARGDLLAVCDADDVVGSGWIAGIAEALEEHDFVSGPLEVERLKATTVVRHPYTKPSTGVHAYTYPPYLPFAGTGSLGFKRAVFDKVGGFDEAVPICGDADFCWRVQLAGIALHPAPRAVLHVRNRRSVKAMVRQARSWGEWNVFLYKRYRPHGMPKLSLRQGLWAWYSVIRGVGRLFDAEQRQSWLWNASYRFGRLMGCLKHRVLAL